MNNLMKGLAAGIALLAAVTAHAAEFSRRSYDYKGFDGIELSWIFDVELVRSDTWSVEVEVSEELVDYLDVELVGGTLRLGARNLPKSLTGRRNYHPTARAVIGLPELKRLGMSGATVCRTSGGFSTGGSCRVRLSGAAKLDGFQMDADTFDVQGSGASSFKLDGKCRRVEIDLSGASKLKFSGSADAVSVDGSGACDLDLTSLRAQTTDIELSGASRCRVDAAGRLTVELTGASACRYVPHPDLDLRIVSVSRGSSLEKL